MINEIFFFNREVLKLTRETPEKLSAEEKSWLIKALIEEVSEFGDPDNSLAEDVDALIDLTYFAIGGLARLGLTEEQALRSFLAVHTANLTKKKGVKETRPQDGSVADAVKPEGWADPVSLIEKVLSNGN